MATQLKLIWTHGEKSILARACGISPQYLSDILSARKRALPELAEKIEAESRKMGLYISRNDVMYPHQSTNPLIVEERTATKTEG